MSQFFQQSAARVLCGFSLLTLLCTACTEESASDSPMNTKSVEVSVEAVTQDPVESVTSKSPFQMRIMDVFTISGKGVVLTGRISSGTIHLNDVVCVPLTDGTTVATVVVGIESSRKMLDSATEGQNIGVLVQDIDKGLINKGSGNLHSGCG